MAEFCFLKMPPIKKRQKHERCNLGAAEQLDARWVQPPAAASVPAPVGGFNFRKLKQVAAKGQRLNV